jgi:hypothetical protein
MRSRGCTGFPFRPSGVIDRGRFQRLQALEDAIAYRQARISAPCADCEAAGSGQKCVDHARDVDLIAEYLLAIQRSTLTFRQPVADRSKPHSG